MHPLSPQQRAIVTVASLATGIGCMIAIALWLTRDATASFVVSHETLDDPHGKKAEWLKKMSSITVGDIFNAYDGQPSTLPGNWPQFRGPNYDNIAPDAPALNTTWGEKGPPVLWQINLGEGQGAAAVRNGRVYVLDFIEAKKADALRCFSLADGKEIWRRSYRTNAKRNHGWSRSIPTVTDDFVVTIGPRAHAMCVDAKTGDLKWGFGMQERYGLKEIPDWHSSQSAIIDDGVAVMAVVGTNVFMAGIDCATGKTVWETPAIPGWKMSHSTITPATLAGKRQYIYGAVGGMAGISADASDRGKLLWTSKEWSPNVVAPSPVVIGDNRFFMTAGYAGGAAVFEITRSGDTFTAALVTKYRPSKGLACEQQTPILLDHRLYSIMPKDAGGYKNQFACADTDGKIIWSSGPTAQFGIGPFFYADGKFWILDDDGVLTVGTATNNQWTQLARARVLPGVDSWGPITLAGSRMIVRDNKLMVCLDLSTGGGS